ncbi:MAG: alkaline phosphatase family protein [Sandaracinus sp.]
MKRPARSALLALALGACTQSPAPTDGGSLPCDPCEDAGPDTGAADDTGVRPDAARPPRDAGPDAYVPRDVGTITRIPEATAAAGREGCAFDRGALPWETLGQEVPIGDDIPIDHFILLMQENRSFDHYFGTMPGVDGLPAGGATNPDADGNPVRSFHATDYCIADVNHEWTGSHLEYHDGANDGFVTENDPHGERAMGYLDGSDLPFYWDLAQTFAMSDHHHCSVLGPTWVNREFYLAATSFGMTENDAIPASAFPVDGEDRVIFQALDRARISYRIYHDSVPFIWGPFTSWALRSEQRAHQSGLESFYTDLENGSLASVVWIDPTWTTGGVTTNDEHPPANPQRGQAFIRDIVQHVMDSPYWASTAIILTYDEHGGFYDHVPPPAACPPGDGHDPILGPTDYRADFDRLGFRVPLIVASPYARTGYVSDHVTDHASILRLIEARFLLPAMTARDANAWAMTDLFDFSTTNTVRSSDLAEATVDAAHAAACAAAF